MNKQLSKEQAADAKLKLEIAVKQLQHFAEQLQESGYNVDVLITPKLSAVIQVAEECKVEAFKFGVEYA